MRSPDLWTGQWEQGRGREEAQPSCQPAGSQPAQPILLNDTLRPWAVTTPSYNCTSFTSSASCSTLHPILQLQVLTVPPAASALSLKAVRDPPHHGSTQTGPWHPCGCALTGAGMKRGWRAVGQHSELGASSSAKLAADSHCLVFVACLCALTYFLLATNINDKWLQ